MASSAVSSTSATVSETSSRSGEAAPQGRRLAIGTPMRAFLERLAASSAEECPWKGYLPQAYREELPRARTPAKGDAAAGALGGLAHQLLEGASITGHVMSLARDQAGCRRVQRALEEAENDEAREELAAELHGHVWEALQCPHANHVLQKCITVLPSRSAQFIIDELSARGISQAARHKYGCRIVQRLVEHCPSIQTRGVIECLLSEVTTIARNQYGNYVLQNLLEHGTQEHRQRIARVLLADLSCLGADPFAVAVVGAALAHCTTAERVPLAAKLVQEDLVVAMACSRLGHHSIPRVLEVLSPKDHMEALRQLLTQAKTLNESRFGQLVLQNVEAGFPQNTAKQMHGNSSSSSNARTR